MSNQISRAIAGFSTYYMSDNGIITRFRQDSNRKTLTKGYFIRPYRQGPKTYQIFIRIVSDEGREVLKPYSTLIHTVFPEYSLDLCRTLAENAYNLLHKPLKEEPLQLENEIWKDCEDYLGELQVSNLGRVKRCARIAHMKNGRTYQVAEKIIQQHEDAKGNHWIYLKRYRKDLRVSKLIAKAFLPNPNNYINVIQIDGNKDNLNIENLQWVES